MEIWEVLDENGKATGESFLANDEIWKQKGIYHAGADIWIINSNGKILIQKRAACKSFQPNVWAMTGGSVKKGETPLEALKRETKEELGVDLEIDKAVEIAHFRGERVWMDEFIVCQEVDLSKVVMQSEEVSEVKFATIEEIEDLVQQGMFISKRWKYVKDEIRDFLLKN